MEEDDVGWHGTRRGKVPVKQVPASATALQKVKVSSDALHLEHQFKVDRAPMFVLFHLSLRTASGIDKADIQIARQNIQSYRQGLRIPS